MYVFVESSCSFRINEFFDIFVTVIRDCHVVMEAISREFRVALTAMGTAV